MPREQALRLHGRVAVITGSGKGIGREEALLFARQGASVLVADIGRDDGVGRAETVAAEIRAAGGVAAAFTGDVATFAGAERLIAAALEHFGRVDVLVNNATLRGPGPIEDVTDELYESVMGANFRSTFATIRAIAPYFKAQRSGAIVNTGSESGLGQPYNAVYAAAKEAVTGLTRCVARELGYFGVRCNQIRPRAGGTQPDGFWAAFETHAAQIEALGPLSMGRVGMYAAAREASVPVGPEQIAPLVVWLCTDAASMLNGRDLLCHADELAILSEPEAFRSTIRDGGWTLDALDASAPRMLAANLRNEFPAGPDQPPAD